MGLSDTSVVANPRHEERKLTDELVEAKTAYVSLTVRRNMHHQWTDGFR
jgi:hypothetical protein